MDISLLVVKLAVQKRNGKGEKTMWKLTIYQEKKYKEFASEQEVSIKHPNVDFLTGMIARFTEAQTETATRYELKKEGDET